MTTTIIKKSLLTATCLLVFSCTKILEPSDGQIFSGQLRLVFESEYSKEYREACKTDFGELSYTVDEWKPEISSRGTPVTDVSDLTEHCISGIVQEYDGTGYIDLSLNEKYNLDAGQQNGSAVSEGIFNFKSHSQFRFIFWWPGTFAVDNTHHFLFSPFLQAKDQVDLLYSTSVCTPSYEDGEIIVHAEFKHALSQIKVIISPQSPTSSVNEVRLVGVYSEGLYDAEDGSISLLDSRSTYILPGTAHVNGFPTLLTSSPNSLFMLPQTVPAGASLEIVIDDGDTLKPYSFDIGGHLWESGKTVTYNLNLHESVITFNGFEVDAPWNQNDDLFL